MKLLQVSRPASAQPQKFLHVGKYHGQPRGGESGQFVPTDPVTRAMQEEAVKSSELVWHETSELTHPAFSKARQEATFALSASRNKSHDIAAAHHDGAAKALKDAQTDETKEHHAKSMAVRKSHKNSASLHRNIMARMTPRRGVDEGSFASAIVGGKQVLGRVEDVSDEIATFKLAVPNGDGVLLLTDCVVSVPAADLKALGAEPVHREVKLMRGDISVPFVEGRKGLEVKSGDTIVDFKDVSIEGFASTFEGTTPRDRDGDAVAPTAFNETLVDFMKNPVLLINHRNLVENIAGSFTKLGVTQKGLAVRAEISNAPSLAHVRFLIMEGHLKSFSIGGMFMFGGNDGHLIEKVVLFEISLVAIPANPDALFQSRSLNLDDVAEATEHFQKSCPATMTKLIGSL